MHLPDNPNPANAANTTTVIIAGGRAQRMGRKNKGLLNLAGRPLLAHVLERVRGQTRRIALNANADLAAYQEFGIPVFTDEPGLAEGPLRGVLAALAHTDTPWILTVPCDAPYLPIDLASRLFDAVAASGKLLAVPHDGTRLQSLCMLMHRQLHSELQRYFLEGGQAIKTWIRQTDHVQVDFQHEAGAFANLNTPAELEQAEIAST